MNPVHPPIPRTILLAFIAVLALAPAAHAAVASCSLSDDWNSPAGDSWLSLVFTAMLAVMLFLALAYMMGVLFLKIEWIVWAKDEFYQMVISVAIVILVGIFTQATCEVSQSLAHAPPFQVADAYLSSLIWDQTLKVAMNAFNTGLTASFFAAFSYQNGFFGFSPLRGLESVTKIMDFLFLLSSSFFSSMMMQLVLIKIVEAIMFKLVLPLGIFFRVFPFLRNAGALFIAVALGFYLVFPLMYVVDKAVMDSIVPDTFTYENAGMGSAPGIIDLGVYFASQSLGSVFQMLNPISTMQAVANLIAPALFLPALNLIITYAFIKSMFRILSQNFPSPFS